LNPVSVSSNINPSCLPIAPSILEETVEAHMATG
jgi:hypothetical protein